VWSSPRTIRPRRLEPGDGGGVVNELGGLRLQISVIQVILVWQPLGVDRAWTLACCRSVDPAGVVPVLARRRMARTVSEEHITELFMIDRLT